MAYARSAMLADGKHRFAVASALARSLRGITVVLIVIVAGCARLPATSSHLPDHATAPAKTGSLAALEAGVVARGGPGKSGFMLLNANEDGLRWRLAVIDSAEHSLDLQYYVWYGDRSGNLLLERVVGAADRGVRVRIMVDDLTTMLGDANHLLRDRMAAVVDAHPNIELRLFNAWRSRSLVGRVADSLSHTDRVNHRMHNKLLVADNRVAIIGGRNIGDNYFGLSENFNFRDLDVLGVGPVARQASGTFDRYWNSTWVTPASDLGIEGAAGELEDYRDGLIAELRSHSALVRFPPERQDWDAAFVRLQEQLYLGTSQVHTDSPDAETVTHHMPSAIRALLATARERVLITNAYVIPGEHAIERMRTQIANGIEFRMLTNSLASHDVPAVNSHYKQWRNRLVEAGVELYEMRPDAAVRPLLADTAPVSSEFMGLHAKAMVIDSRRVFIGSMNLDPRSWAINSEMGVVIESPELGQALSAIMTRDMSPRNAWEVIVTADGNVHWVAGDEILTEQPARTFWQRIEDVIFTVFPADLY